MTVLSLTRHSPDFLYFEIIWKADTSILPSTSLTVEQQLSNVGRTWMTLVYLLTISFDKDKCGVVISSHLFQLLPTEVTCRDKEVDEVIKKWRDRIREGQEDGDILCAVGTYVFYTHHYLPNFSLFNFSLYFRKNYILIN